MLYSSNLYAVRTVSYLQNVGAVQHDIYLDLVALKVLVFFDYVTSNTKSNVKEFINYSVIRFVMNFSYALQFYLTI